MATVNVPSRSDYTVELLVGTTLSATVTIENKTISIEPVKSGEEYSIVDANAATGSMALFPVVS
jgi:hypothetical protein